MFDRPIRAEDGDLVRFGTEAAAWLGDVVRDQKVKPLPGKLGGGVALNIGRLSGEADPDEWRDFTGRDEPMEVSEHVRVRCQAQSERAIRVLIRGTFLDLVVGRRLHAVICHGGGHDEGVAIANGIQGRRA